MAGVSVREPAGDVRQLRILAVLPWLPGVGPAWTGGTPSRTGSGSKARSSRSTGCCSPGRCSAPGAADWTPRRRAGFATLNNGAFFVLTTWILHARYPGSILDLVPGRWGGALRAGRGLPPGAAPGGRRDRGSLPRPGAPAGDARVLRVLQRLAAQPRAGRAGVSCCSAAPGGARNVCRSGHRWRRPWGRSWWRRTSWAIGNVRCRGHPPPGRVRCWSLPRGGASTGESTRPPPAEPDPRAAPGFHATLAVAPACFSALGCATWLWAIERTLAHAVCLVPALAAAAAVLTASVYVLRVRAVPFYALAFLLAAYVHRFRGVRS